MDARFRVVCMVVSFMISAHGTFESVIKDGVVFV